MKTISTYITVLNVIKGGYPFKECIKSIIPISDEIIVVDGGSTDATKDVVMSLQRKFRKIKLIEHKWDHNIPMMDGIQKAFARSCCTGDYCFQIDADEVLRGGDAVYERIRAITEKDIDILLTLNPTFFGGINIIRADFPQIKPRLTKNHWDLTHGIPLQYRKITKEGNSYCDILKSDGCDMIDRNTLKWYTYKTYSVDISREFLDLHNKLMKDRDIETGKKWVKALEQDCNTMGRAVVFHYSWINIANKLRLGDRFWTYTWRKLYGQEIKDATVGKEKDISEEARAKSVLATARTALRDFGNLIYGIKLKYPKLVESWLKDKSTFKSLEDMVEKTKEI